MPVLGQNTCCCVCIKYICVVHYLNVMDTYTFCTVHEQDSVVARHKRTNFIYAIYTAYNMICACIAHMQLLGYSWDFSSNSASTHMQISSVNLAVLYENARYGLKLLLLVWNQAQIHTSRGQCSSSEMPLWQASLANNHLNHRKNSQWIISSLPRDGQCCTPVAGRLSVLQKSALFMSSVHWTILLNYSVVCTNNNNSYKLVHSVRIFWVSTTQCLTALCMFLWYISLL